jgi:hypothetical protein
VMPMTPAPPTGGPPSFSSPRTQMALESTPSVANFAAPAVGNTNGGMQGFGAAPAMNAGSNFNVSAPTGGFGAPPPNNMGGGFAAGPGGMGGFGAPPTGGGMSNGGFSGVSICFKIL